MKCHHVNTVSRASVLQRMAPDIRVYGGIVLNSYVGYLNPAAVEAGLKLGGMPGFGYCTVPPVWQCASRDKIAEAVARVGAPRCLLVSDTGQRHNPLPSEALRVFPRPSSRRPSEGDVDTMIRATRTTCSTSTRRPPAGRRGRDLGGRDGGPVGPRARRVDRAPW